MIASLLAALLALGLAQSPREVMARAVADFRAGRIEQSVAGFDRLAALVPDQAPELWQRGIAQLYAGRFRDCRDMFVSHRTVNPADVENAAWRGLPDVPGPRDTGAGAGRGRFGSVGAVLRPARRRAISRSDRRSGQRPNTGEMAANDRHARAGGHMHDVARVHVMLSRR